MFALQLQRQYHEDPHALHIGTEPARGWYLPQMSDGSPRARLLSGRTWDFGYFRSLSDVPQDWEKVITREDRCESYLRRSVRDIVGAICETNDALGVAFPCLHTKLSRDVFFITTQELEDMYPDKTPKERENALLREHPTVFLMQIGGKLRSGKPHDGRAPDYDDWSLNGDILMWNSVLGCAFEVSSMGIRVDADAMRRQLAEAGCPERAQLPFHKLLLDGTLPLTMGGGIGQSRLCMLLLGKAHIGEVQVSLWDDATTEICRKNQIELL